MKNYQPAMLLDKNSKFVWRSGADVLQTFKRFGWVPPSEKKLLFK